MQQPLIGAFPKITGPLTWVPQPLSIYCLTLDLAIILRYREKITSLMFYKIDFGVLKFKKVLY